MNRRHSQHAFLDNGGSSGQRIRDMDWSAHPMGPVDGWEPALRTGLGIVLSSSFPTFLAWGEELAFFFNDAYAPMLGRKSEWALGQPYARVWPEVWDALSPTLARVQARESFFFENYATTLERHGYPEQAWFTFSYSPLRDELGEVRGVICTVVEVTEKIEALARHKEAEERLAMSLEASGNIGTWSVELETYATHVDGRFARLFQMDAALARSGAELTRFTDMIHPDDRPRVLEAIAAAIRDETLYDIEYRIPQRSGLDAWVNARGKVYADPATGKRRFAGIAVDISERKTAELALLATERLASAASLRAEESRRRLDGLLEAAPVGIVYVDTAGRMLMSNAANRRIWGDYADPAGVAEYAGWKGWWPADGRPVAPHEWPIARALGGDDTGEAIVEIEPFGSPGVRKTVLVRAQALRDAAGAIVGGVAANMDITAQVAAERALKDSERKFRNITNVIPQMVWSVNVEGTEDYVNERWHAFTGCSQVQFAGNGWRQVIHPDDLPQVLAAWKRSFAGNTPFEIEHRLVHHAGDYRWVLNRALPCTDAVGRVTHWMGTLTDIHDQKAGEEELRAAARRKDEFLAMLAHELRNPLAPISNAAQLIAMASPADKRLRQSSEVITRQVRHMTELVDDLLDVSRVTRGLVTLEREPVGVRAIVLGAVEQARPLIEARGQQLSFALDDAGLRIDGDRTRLVQVMSNLLNNAAKYTPQGGAIAVSCRSHGDKVTIAVADTGIGIAPDVLPLVFDLFTQAERTPDRSQGGLGLGLALVKSLVQLHGGQVEAKSEGLGKGSTFSVTLDVVPEPAAPSPGPGLPSAAQAGVAAGGKRILIVDDNVDAAQSLGEILTAFGHAVATASTPYDGLAYAAGDWPDVFVLDIGLPDIDGYELARRLRALPQARPALYVALTGYGQAHDKVLSLSAGFDHHFVKPVDLGSLNAAIDAAGRQAPRKIQGGHDCPPHEKR